MQPIEETSWIGGQSSDPKHGPRDSFGRSRHLDFRKKGSSMTVLPAMIENTGGIIQTLPLNMIEVEGEKFYVGDEGGNVYLKEAGLWSQIPGNIGAFQHGMVYMRHMDRLFMTCEGTISSVKNAGENFGSPTLEANTLAASRDVQLVTTGNTYTTTTAIDETALHRQTFSPNTEPMYSVKLLVAVKGTAPVTITLHDGANNLLGSVTLAAASMTNGALAEWVFTDLPRLNVAPSGSEYHIHVTHGTGTSTTFTTTNANDFESAAFETWSNRLVPGDLEHPMIQFLQYLCICNERYLSVWEPITLTPGDLEYLRHRLVFRSQDQTMGLALWGDYLAIACGTWSNNTNGIEAGRIYFWGGTSKTYDQVLEIPEGAPQSLFSHLNRLYWVANGIWYTWAGGDIEKVWQFPHTDTEYKSLPGPTYVYPNMMAVRNGILMTAFPNDTADPEIEYGAYSFGRREKDYPLSAGYSYTISTGTRQNVVAGVSLVQLGFLKSFGSDLYMGWADYTGVSEYGIDLVSSSNAPSASGIYESLIRDDGRPRKEKGAAELYITFLPLPTGSVITPKYKINRADTWTYGTDGDGNTVTGSVGETEVRLNINKRYKEIEYGYDWVCGATTFEITGIELVRDHNQDEAD